MTYQKLYVMDVIEGLNQIEDESIDMVMTSPPYWGLRDYGIEGQIGLEDHPQKFIDKMVEVFALIKQKLKKTGSIYLNLGDTYFANREKTGLESDAGLLSKEYSLRGGGKSDGQWLQPKQLLGMPWRTAIAMQNDGWILRNAIIWNKPNPMPSSVKDRLNNTYEFIFHFVKSRKYYYDLGAIREKHNTKFMPFNVRVRDAGTDRFLQKAPKEERQLYDTRGVRLTYKGKRNDPNDGQIAVKAWHESGKNPGDVVKYDGKFQDMPHFKSVSERKNYQRQILGVPHDSATSHPNGRNPGDVLKWQQSENPSPKSHCNYGGAVNDWGKEHFDSDKKYREFLAQQGRNPGDVFTQGLKSGMRENPNSKQQISREYPHHSPKGRIPNDVQKINESNHEFEGDIPCKVLKGCPIHSLLYHPEILKILSCGEPQHLLLNHTFDKYGCLVPVLSSSLLSKLSHNSLDYLLSRMGFENHANVAEQILENAHDNKKSGLCFPSYGQESYPQTSSHTKSIQTLREIQDDNSDYSSQYDELIATSHNKRIHKTVSLSLKHDSIFFEIPSHIAHILQSYGCICSYYTYSHLALNNNTTDFWSIVTTPYKEAHFAVYPEAICIKPIKSSCPKEICNKCGFIRERITKPTEEYSKIIKNYRMVNFDPEEIGKYLKGQREKLGLSIKEIAKHFPSISGGMTGCVWNWENGENIPTSEQYKKLKEILNLDSRFDLLLENPAKGIIETEKRTDNPEFKVKSHGFTKQNWQKQTETIGFTSCSCENNKWIPGTVLDPFVGSGTTMKVARDLGRNCIGIEINKDYVEIIKRRMGWNNETLVKNWEVVVCY